MVKKFKFLIFLSVYFYVLFRDLLDPQIVYSVVFPQIPCLVFKHVFIQPYFTLASITITNLLQDGFHNDRQELKFTSHCFCYIHSWMKEIHIIPIQYLFLECSGVNAWNLTLHKFKITITPYTRRTELIFARFIFILFNGIFP